MDCCGTGRFEAKGWVSRLPLPCWGSRLPLQGLGFRVWGLGFRVVPALIMPNAYACLRGSPSECAARQPTCTHLACVCPPPTHKLTKYLHTSATWAWRSKVAAAVPSRAVTASGPPRAPPPPPGVAATARPATACATSPTPCATSPTPCVPAGTRASAICSCELVRI